MKLRPSSRSRPRVWIGSQPGSSIGWTLFSPMPIATLSRYEPLPLPSLHSFLYLDSPPHLGGGSPDHVRGQARWSAHRRIWEARSKEVHFICPIHEELILRPREGYDGAVFGFHYGSLPWWSTSTPKIFLDRALCFFLFLPPFFIFSHFKPLSHICF